VHIFAENFSFSNKFASIEEIIFLFVSFLCIISTDLIANNTSETNFSQYPALNFFLPGFLIPGYVVSADPSISWFAVTAIGLFFGKKIKKDVEKSFKLILWTALSFLCTFAILRAINTIGIFKFGSTRYPQHNGTVIEWIQCYFTLTKYPPSLTFILLFLGLNFLIGYTVYKIPSFHEYSIAKPALVYGKVSLFFYMAHIVVYVFIGLIWHRSNALSVGWAYPLWILGLVLLYPLCFWFGIFKSKTPLDSIWRFF